jgi:hypothetical protein
MRVLIAGAAGAALLALSIPIGSASAAMPLPVARPPAAPGQALQPGGPALVQADYYGPPGWHHHWRHEWRDHWHPYLHPYWHPYWHHHWHHGWYRPYGY